MRWIMYISVVLVSGFLTAQEDSVLMHTHRHLKANVSHISFNIALNRVNRYFLDSGRDWADVGWTSWKENLGTVPVWDWDLFTTNWFAHPYQGGIYYNAARSLKMDYFSAMSYTVLGTAMWEYFGEDLPPSSNDFITNILGGIYLGEVMFRLSENILDDRLKGRERRRREILAAFVNPMGGLNRVMYGEIKRKELSRNHLSVPVRTRVFTGVNYIFSASGDNPLMVVPEMGIELEYGDIDREVQDYSPFDLFWMRAWLRWDNKKVFGSDSTLRVPHFNFSSSALLLGRRPRTPRAGTQLYGIFQDYEYLKNIVYEIGVIGVSFGVHQHIVINNSSFRSRTHLGIVVLGAVGSESMSPDVVTFDRGERDYIMGHGISCSWIWVARINEQFIFDGRYDLWYIPVSSGPEGEETVQRISFNISTHLSDRFTPGVAFSGYRQNGMYREGNITGPFNRHIFEWRLFLTYKI